MGFIHIILNHVLYLMLYIFHCKLVDEAFESGGIVFGRMDQFRQIGEVLGSLRALMVLKHEISINQRQCCLLFDMLELAFQTISDEIKHNLRLEEKSTKWKPLELPMKELHRVFKEADFYIRQCMDIKDWWGRAISLHMNMDCLELHLHNLLCCFPVVIEAIETAAEITGVDEDEMSKRRVALMQKYDQECDDFKLFLWKFGKQYLVPREMCIRIESAWREDRWLLLEKIGEKKTGKNEPRIAELLMRKMNDGDASDGKLLPSSVLFGPQDYVVKRRLGSGSGSSLKEIHWMGENFALRTFYGDIGPLHSEICSVLSLSHPNVLRYLCAFYDEDRKEGFLVMELMSKDLESYIKEHSGQRNRIPFSIPVAVDMMLQIARGMEYLHSKNIYHGVLNPSSILLKARAPSIGGFQAKVSGFSLTSFKSYHTAKSPKPTGLDLDIWLAPEVLAEVEQQNGSSSSKGTTYKSEKADVYSFGMLCFELLTGKVPFEDGHLQGEKIARNIRAGERPLFSYPSPKYLANLTRKCWQTNPNLRPTFSSICRILRYIKKILVINPDHGHPDSAPPLVDYCDMEAGYLKKFPGETGGELGSVLKIPFQMFAYKIVEKEKIESKKWELATEGSVHRPTSMFDDDNVAAMDDLFLTAPSGRRSVCSEIIDTKSSAIGVDMRSVISEAPHWKLHQYDQRSFGSESPRTRFSTAVADKGHVIGETPERKRVLVIEPKSPNIQASLEKKSDENLSGRKLQRAVSDKAMMQRAVSDKAIIAARIAESQTSSPRLQENGKSWITKVTEQKPDITEIIEKKLSLGSVVDQKLAFSKSSQGQTLSRPTRNQEVSEIPENKIRQNEESVMKTGSISPTAPEKKTEPVDKLTQKPENSENPGKSEKPGGKSEKQGKKAMHIKKLKNIKTNWISGSFFFLDFQYMVAAYAWCYIKS